MRKNSAESPQVDWSDIFPLCLPNNSPSVLICPSPVCFWRVCPPLPPLSSPAGLLLLMQACSQLPAVIRPVLGSPENKMLLLASWTRSVSVTSPPASSLYLISFQAVSAWRGNACQVTKKQCALSQWRWDLVSQSRNNWSLRSLVPSCLSSSSVNVPHTRTPASPNSPWQCTVNSSDPAPRVSASSAERWDWLLLFGRPGCSEVTRHFPPSVTRSLCGKAYFGISCPFNRKAILGFDLMHSRLGCFVFFLLT